jgi:hypothetical protein
MIKPPAVIIFSKDRACQLDTLLRSMKDYLSAPNSSIFILFKSTSAKFREGYDRLRKKNILDSIKWVEEKAFKPDLLEIMNTISDDSSIMFLVDDIIFYRPIQIDKVIPLLGNRHLFASLRCDRSYSADIQPRFSHNDGHLEWKWTFRSSPRGAWNYPFSVDGNIFQKKFIGGLCGKLDFKGPNSFESGLHSLRWKLSVRWRNRAVAPLHAVLFNNPLNKVQTEGETWHRNVSAEELNEKYLDGFYIDNKRLYSANPDAIHFAVDVNFIKDDYPR